MVSRRITALLAVLVLLSGVSVVAGDEITSPPTMTVTNEDTTTYRVTAFTAENRQTALLMNFAVTTREGERRLATLSQMVWPEGYRNVTLVDDGIPTRHVTVDPGEEETMTVTDWTPGNVTVYVVEDLGDNETHVHTKIVSCTQREQEHTLTLREDGSGGSSVCASSVDWLLA
ncbi:hypothetical protein [Halopelagius longus]|uniref:Uncharacterized protein n=1 Tax=Halopelagius longus TaxID=1236180 RepID=A0A1H1FPP1_9EURY|nr:hypothetical protein [Halopelagius longus]RDI69989.1 hypothetical protein DWB78_15255 [Halopelagius longus]SDR02962.1 hypothetical protein SAMN05216278_3341 [Halopelagius longus]